MGSKLSQCLKVWFAAGLGPADQARTGISETMWRGWLGFHRVLP